MSELKDLGSCKDYHTGNATQRGLKTFNEDVKKILVNIYVNFGGAKGKDVKKKKAYQNIAKDDCCKLAENYQR